MLLAIAILPLTVEKWWSSNLNKLIVSLILGLPVGIYFAVYDMPELTGIGIEYFSFIVLLASLFVISGGILIKGDIQATPLTNVIFLLIGSILASFMGTTGAAMLLIRPLLATNKERKYIVHTVIFFTFLVGNIGGCLTPLGDPPLFMGYLMGVPFSWTFSLWPEWAFAVGAVLLIYFVFDSYLYSKEPISRISKDRTDIRPLKFFGLINFPLLLGVVLAVAFITRVPYREIVMVVLALLSLKMTKKSYRHENDFNWHPIIEVAVLFFGIFLTMIPSIVLLHTRGSEMGFTNPSHFFWATGLLSSFLDNTPTYVTFFALGQGLKQAGEIVGMPEAILRAISLGAVFFGASTYIGNAPNFMIKVIAEDKKIKMPSFFGYMIYSVLILIPVFLLVDWIFI
jgi:Na+/H+ antiporter NhaD/arsenite permease-like protein